MRTRQSVVAVAFHLSHYGLKFKQAGLRVLRRATVVLANNFGRVLGVTLIVSLLATSAPTAAPALVDIVKEAERTVVSRSQDSMFFSALRQGLMYGSGHYWSLNNKLASRTTTIPVSYAAVAAVTSPAAPVVDAPTNLTITSTANTSVSLSWTAPAGSVNNYQVERTQSVSVPFSQIGTPTATNFNDTTVSSGNAYLYRVRAVSGGIPSSPSNMVVGTAITYTDNPLSVGVTQIKAVHVSEVRQSINAVRSVAGLSAASWLDTSLPGIFVKAVHIQEMRDRLGEALTVLSVPVAAYTDPVLATGANGTPVKKIHIEELRQRASGSSSSGSGGSSGDTSVARLDPLNSTGGPGEDPLSRNFNWSVALLNLPGRSGMDLSLSLAYNSLVWTRSGSSIAFDHDRGFPSPGFRIGFPVIQQQQYFNSEVGKSAFLLISPDGSRVELRQVGTSSLYESADSSHMQLDSATMTLRTTDGAQFSYASHGGEFQCTKIKDRNGNFITVNYTAFGRVDTIVDTLSRSIKFNYDGSQSLTSITQTWKVNGSPVTHTWASFIYSNPHLTIQTNFTGLTKIGPANGSTIKVLTSVILGDSSRFDFDYTSWGQVRKVNNYAPDGHILSYRSYNLPLDASTAWTDCPRFTERRDWAENFNRSGPNGSANLPVGAEQEVITTYAVPTSTSWTLPNGTPQTGLRAEVISADFTSQKTTQKIYYEGVGGTSTGWRRSLPTLVESFDNASTLRKQSVTTWTQDNTSVSYLVNPRVTETNIYDPAGPRRRTVIEYGPYEQWGLPHLIREYASDAATEIRRSVTDYDLSQVYLDRRIIGLVSSFKLSDTVVWQTKITYTYDEPTKLEALPATAVQHDPAFASTSFTTRGNLTGVSRWDVTDINNVNKTLTTSASYDTAGCTIRSTDASGHQTTISYADAFAENGVNPDAPLGFSTFAYPTAVTDADGYTYSTRYDYDFGGITWKQTPLPNTTVNTPGPQQTSAYDTIGRIKKITNLFNGGYTRYEYSNSQTRVDTYITVVDGASEENGNEARSFQISDGHGRVIASATAHPSSTGGFSAQLILYDVLGRPIKSSNPTETNSNGAPFNWTATGDDAITGWLYTQQTYDWQGRPLVMTNTDGTTKEANYSGCGCAGGDVVTLTDEGTLENGVAKKRQQRVYADVLGRTVKTEVLNWDGTGPFGTGGTVYSATVASYNARDQVTTLRQYAGPEGSTTFQDTINSYDVYGRLKTRHTPEQDAGAVTTWDYHSDDTIQKITDARNATQTFAYNNRHQTTGISYGAPGGSGITVPASVSFTYDGAGNRLSMSDGTGGVNYQYTQLSQLESESRTINGLAGTKTLAYEYNLAGELKSLTNSTNQRVNYGRDNLGRLNSVTGTNFSVSPMINSITYRAWGGTEQVAYANGRTLNVSYNSRMQVSHFEIPATSFASVMSTDYEYYNDGRLRYMKDNKDGRFDRLYKYDHAARLIFAVTGPEARGEPATNDRPYRQTSGYDAFNHLTVRSTKHWSRFPNYGISNSWVNNRRMGWTYDADGRLTVQSTTRSYTYDAAGRMIFTSGGNLNQFFDGDSRRVKTNEPNLVTYYLRSSVLGGQVIEEFDGAGAKQRGYIYNGGKLIASQSQNGFVSLVHEDPSGAKGRKTHSSLGNTIDFNELDPQGAEVETGDPYVGNPDYFGRPEGSPLLPGFGNVTLPGDCTLDGVFVPCDIVNRFLASGAAVACPAGECGTRRVDVFVRYQNGDIDRYSGLTQPFAAFADGSSGFMLGNTLLQDGFSITFNGDDARAAAEAFFEGMANGNFGTAVSDAIKAGIEENDQQSHHAQKRRGRKKGTTPKKKPQVQVVRQSSCSRFADELANRLYNTMVAGGFHPGARHDLANDMFNQGYHNVDLYGNRYVKNVTPIDGFKTSLTTNGQDADVYRHVLANAGDTLHGTPGGDFSNVIVRTYDWIQSALGRGESDVEKADNQAGVEVGGLMLSTALAGKSGDYNKLKTDIKAVLCSY